MTTVFATISDLAYAPFPDISHAVPELLKIVYRLATGLAPGRRNGGDAPGDGRETVIIPAALKQSGREDLNEPRGNAAFHERFSETSGDVGVPRNTAQREGTGGDGARGNWWAMGTGCAEPWFSIPAQSRNAELERMGDAGQLKRIERYPLSIHVAGVAVECILRAFRLPDRKHAAHHDVVAHTALCDHERLGDRTWMKLRGPGRISG